jgi:hypothetical protein
MERRTEGIHPLGITSPIGAKVHPLEDNSPLRFKPGLCYIVELAKLGGKIVGSKLT